MSADGPAGCCVNKGTPGIGPHNTDLEAEVSEDGHLGARGVWRRTRGRAPGPLPRVWQGLPGDHRNNGRGSQSRTPNTEPMAAPPLAKSGARAMVSEMAMDDHEEHQEDFEDRGERLSARHQGRPVTTGQGPLRRS